MDEHDSLVVDLVVEWEQARTSGRAVDLREICREHPHLLSAVEEKVAALQIMTPVFSIGEGLDTAVDSTGCTELVTTATTGEIQYVIGPVHARGGLGEVVLASDTKLNRSVAVKRLREQYCRNPLARKRFLRETEITSQLQHPGVVPVYGFAHDCAGNPVYAMRFVEGTTLHEAAAKLHARGAIDRTDREFRNLLSRFVTVCQTVAYAHSRGIIHRDLKPANVMIGAYGETVVLDWGLAKRVGKPDWRQLTTWRTTRRIATTIPGRAKSLEHPPS